MNEWKALVGAPPPEISPAVKAAIRQMDEHEAHPERARPQARGKPTRAALERPQTGQETAEAPPAVAARPTPSQATRPRSMENSLKVGMPPTVAEWQAASTTVSAWIKIIADGEPDVDKRMRRLDAFVADLKTMVRERQGGPAPEATVGAKTRITPTSHTAATSAVPSTTTPATGATTPAPLSPLPARETTVAAPPAVTVTREEKAPTAEARSAAAVAGKETPATPASAPAGLSARGPTGQTTEVSVPPEHPDDARRRKKRQEEIEKRKRQRKAVLGRKSRGMGR